MTNADTGAVPTAANLMTIAENILQGVESHQGLINSIAGMAGILPEVSLAEKALPMVCAVLQFMQEESGKGLLEVFQDLLNHLTPGQPNATELNAVIPEGS
jgi:hypothetical protein